VLLGGATARSRVVVPKETPDVTKLAHRSFVPRGGVTAVGLIGYAQLMRPRTRDVLSRRLAASSVLIALAIVPGTRAQAQGAQRLPAVDVNGQYVRDTSGWSMSDRRAALDSLAAGKRRWEARRLERYRLSIYLRCGFCGNYWHDGPAGTQPAAVVHGSTVIRTVAYRPAGPVVAAQWMFASVDTLFAMLEREANDPRRQLRSLTLDPLYGVPRSWETDDVHNGHNGYHITDAGYRAEVPLFEPDSETPRWFVEAGGGWNFTAPASFGDNYTHGYSLRLSYGREVAPHLLLRVDAHRNEFDHRVQFYPPCAPPGCSGPYFYTVPVAITGVTASGMLNIDRRGIFYATAGGGLYVVDAGGREAHFGASAGAGIAIPILGRLRAVVEGRYHALFGATNGPPWILPVTLGLRY
jgi:hypothetical protein